MITLHCCDCNKSRNFSPSELTGKCARTHAPGGIYRCRVCWNAYRHQHKECVVPHRRANIELKCVDCHKVLRKVTNKSKYSGKRCRACSNTFRVFTTSLRVEQPIKAKRRVLVCPSCGKSRLVTTSVRSPYCMSCARSGPSSGSWRGGKVKLTCNACGLIRTVSRSSAAARRRKTGEYFCKTCARSRKPTGPNSATWRGGLSYVKYPACWTPQLRRDIRKRDSYTCRICGHIFTVGDRTLAVHHIDYDKNNCCPDNLVTLCTKCHTKTNFNRAAWIIFFKPIEVNHVSS